MATKYTVKSGDTKTKLKQLYGIDLNDAQYRSTDPNKLFAGEQITIPDNNAVASVAPIVQNNQVDLSQIKADVKPFEETPVNSTSVIKTKDNPDGTTTNILANGQQDTGRYQRNADGTYTFVPGENSGTPQFQSTSFEDLAPEEQLRRTSVTIQNEIATLEEKMANRASQRTSELDDAGVFEDMRALNELKAEFRSAQDRDIEIPVEARQNLRGRQATKTEFDQATRPELEKNLLRTLAASRNVSRLTDTINTNISVIDSKLEAEAVRDEFLYKSKIDRLNKVESIYGNIITERQKNELEEKKFQYSLILEGVKSDNTLRNDLLKDIAKKGIGGIQLDGLMNASIDELLSFSGNLTSPNRWSEMTFEEAAMTLDKESFDKFEAYKEWEKSATDEEKAGVTAGLAAQQGALGVIDTLESMLNDKQGLKTSVGVGPLGSKDFNVFGLGVESTKFRANAKSLVSQQTLNTLIELKSTGATLGAISEKELQILINAQNRLGTIFDETGNATGRFNMKEDDFRTELETMRMAAMKTYIAAAIGKEAYARAGYLNLDASNSDDFQTIQKRFNDLKENGATAATSTNYYEQDFNENLNTTFEVIRAEEGLRTEAYQDTTGKWTIGFGNTMINGRPVQPGDRLSPQQAETLMQQSVIQNYTTFTDSMTRPLTSNQFAALTSFEYNLGPGVWSTPTGKQILAYVDQGRPTEAARLMQQYNKARNPATGQLETNRVLAQRRLREGNLLLT